MAGAWLEVAEDEHALRTVTARYARLADRGEPAAVSELFTEDGVLEISSAPAAGGTVHRRSEGRPAIASALRLDRYIATSHVLGQGLFEIEDDGATGETYCMAYQLYQVGEERRRRTLGIRYLDTFLRRPGLRGPGGWLIRERRLVMDWAEDLVSPDGTTPPPPITP